jgi:hypothetical protein
VLAVNGLTLLHQLQENHHVDDQLFATSELLRLACSAQVWAPCVATAVDRASARRQARSNKKIPWFHPRQLAVLLLLHLLEGELRLRKHLFLKNLAAASTVRAKIREA